MSDQQNRPRIVQPDTVIRLGPRVPVPEVGQTFMGNQAPQVMHSVLSKQQPPNAWTGPGTPCEVLSPGGQWTKGAVKFVMVFTPDEAPTE